MRFTDFVGNEKVKQQLSFLEASGRLPHAFVIEGDEGMGKRTLAREIALNLFCRGDEKPCRVCSQCSKVQKGIHPDIYEYSAPGGARSFHVDVVRDVKENVYMQPNEAEYKVYILGNCQCMNDSAQNALLKVLEEPPEYAVFFLTVDSKSALLETVLSRSTVLTLEGVPANIGADYICSKYDDIEYDEALRACTVWGGNIGKAIESLGDSKLSRINSIVCDICASIVANDEYSLLTACSVFEKDRETLAASLVLLKTVFRDALVYCDGSDVLSGNVEIARDFNSKFSKKKIMNLIYACENLHSLTVKNANNSVLITKMCYDFRRAIGR